jgi:uncharacterized protein YyaL (SSP411 family)
MLYDNALLARVYALAHRVTGREAWRDVAERTLDYLLREMRTPDGGFAAAQDADSPGGEGAFFVWTPEQLLEVLTPDEARAVAIRYGVRPEGNFEGATILHVAAPLELVEQAVGPDAKLILASARGKLAAARSGRAAPARDGKVITSWNGLAIAAFADAGVILGRPDLIEVARETAAFLLEGLERAPHARVGRRGRPPPRLPRRLRRPRPRAPGPLRGDVRATLAGRRP